MTTIVDDEWEAFLNDDVIKTPICSEKQTMNTTQTEKTHANVLPKCDDLYISTTTKVLFLNQPIEIDNIFWEIPIIEYWPSNHSVPEEPSNTLIIAAIKDGHDVDKLQRREENHSGYVKERYYELSWKSEKCVLQLFCSYFAVHIQ